MIGIHKNHPTAYFDGIRGIAVLFVWLSHTSGRGQSLSEWLSFHGIGHIGVMLFFVLSGYLLALPFNNTRNLNIRAYIVRRFLRIAPLFYLVVTLVFLYQLQTGHIDASYLYISEGIYGLVLHILFLKGDGVFWTIPTEFTFYLILPLVVIFLRRGAILRYALVFLIATVYGMYHFLIYAGFIDLPSIKISEINKHSQYLDVFLIGVLFGMLSNKQIIKEKYSQYRLVLDRFILIIFLLTLSVSIIFVSKSFLIFNQPFYGFKFLSGLFAVIFGSTLLSAHQGNIYLRSIFNFKPFIYCGVVGYSWYLLHFMIIQFVNEFDNAPWVKFVIGTVLISLVSFLSYKFIEEPFIRIGKYISSKYFSSNSEGIASARF